MKITLNVILVLIGWLVSVYNDFISHQQRGNTGVMLLQSQAKNLYDNNAQGNELGFYMDNNGNKVAHPDFLISHFIEVKPNTTYRPTEKQFVCFFDGAGTVVLNQAGVYNRPTTEFTTTALTRFIRLSVPLSSRGTFQLIEGASPTTFEAYKVIQNGKVVAATRSINFGKNLFNKDDTGNEPRKYITNTGTKVADNRYLISHSIAVKGNTQYTANNIQFLTYYATDTTINLGGEAFNRTNATITTPASAAFVKLTVPYNILTSFQFQEGSTIDPKATYGAKVYTSIGKPLSFQNKTIWWCGTSIPALGQYPELACAQIGATCINKAVSSSSARKANTNGNITGMSWYAAMWNLSSTVAEKQALIDKWDMIRGSLTYSPPTILTPADKEYILNTSFERRLLPYLNGTLPMPDLFIFNHNFNDNVEGEADRQFATMPTDLYDRNTYIGAINFLVKKIITANPRAHIAFISHYENQLYPKFAAADNVLASHWKCPIFRLYQKTGWTQQRVPNTKGLWSQPPYSLYSPRLGESIQSDMTRLRYAIPDGVHPSSDPTGKAQAFLGQLVSSFLTDVLTAWEDNKQSSSKQNIRKLAPVKTSATRSRMRS